MSTNFIYGLIDPNSLLIRYIGQATRVERPLSHATCCHSEDTHKARWIRSLLEIEQHYQVCVLAVAKDRTDLNDLERWWIAYARLSGWPLTNLTDGGQGALNPHPEVSARRQQAMRGNKNGLGQTKSDAVRQQLRELFRGKPLTLEHRAKLARAKIGNRNAAGSSGGWETRRLRQCLELALSLFGLVYKQLEIS